MVFGRSAPEDWISRLTQLIEDPDLRQKMGLHGMDTVEKEYSLAVTSEKFLGVLKNLRKIVKGLH